MYILYIRILIIIIIIIIYKYIYSRYLLPIDNNRNLAVFFSPIHAGDRCCLGTGWLSGTCVSVPVARTSRSSHRPHLGSPGDLEQMTSISQQNKEYHLAIYSQFSH